MALSDYITECRRLLHDANGNFYTDAELTDYINAGRSRLVRDTGCLRAYQTTSVVQGQEIINTGTLPGGTGGTTALDILGINLIWGNTRVYLRYMPWTQFNAELRYWQNFQGRPIAFSMYGQTQIYIGPIPDQTYSVELDTIVLPTALTASAPNETIPDPYTAPVAYYAAHKAKYKEQAYGESEIFKQEYGNQVKSALASVFTRRMASPYSMG